MAGADAVEVGTATFRDPRAPARVLAGLQRWCRLHDVGDVRRLVGAVQGRPWRRPAVEAVTADGPGRRDRSGPPIAGHPTPATGPPPRDRPLPVPEPTGDRAR